MFFSCAQLAHYIKEETRDGSLQCIIISLKLEAFQQSDALVGVTAEVRFMHTASVDFSLPLHARDLI